MILLRSKRTQLYYASAGGWTPDPKKAMVFDDLIRACFFSKTAKLINVEIVQKTDHGETTFAVTDTPPASPRSR